MRIHSSVTALSWIPLEAVEMMTAGLPFKAGVMHYDEVPPEPLTDLDELVAGCRIRVANQLSAWIDVVAGRIVAHGQTGRGSAGLTRLTVGRRDVRLQSVAMPTLTPQPVVTDDAVRFVQTAGARPNLPAPRHVRRKPGFQLTSPPAWTTLALTITVNGEVGYDLAGASQFPRHWIYDDAGWLIKKSGLIDFRSWYRTAFERNTPWGEKDQPAVVASAESLLERGLSPGIIKSGPHWRRLQTGEFLTRQGERSTDMFLVFDGLLEAVIDNERIAEIGPGAVVGEMAVLGEGERVASLRALTPCRVAVFDPERIDRVTLAELAEPRRRPQ